MFSRPVFLNRRAAVSQRFRITVLDNRLTDSDVSLMRQPAARYPPGSFLVLLGAEPTLGP
jgi:hypothetical protein